MKIICKVIHGSRLYKLHSESSDYDEKGIMLPTLEDCLLNHAPKNITWKEPDLNKEHELFSLTEFFRHASRGEGYAIDLLHCGDEDIIQSSELFEYLRDNKSKFYTKKMVGLVGFAKTQAIKYGLKAERLNAVKKVLEVLKKAEEKGVAKLYQMWDDLPKGEHIYFGEELRNNQKDNRYVEVAGKKLQATIAVSYGTEILEHLITNFGARVQKASELDEKDVKSLSHSFRTAFQLRHIYLNNGFTYPLPESEFLKDVKFRRLDWRADQLDDRLNELITEVEQLAEKSTYPEKVDQKWLDSIVLGAYSHKLLDFPEARGILKIY